MTKQLLIIALFLLVMTTQAQQVQNPGFENWTGVFPTNWGSYSQALVAVGQPNPHLEAQTTTVHSGTYAIVLQNQNLLIAGGNNVPGGICTCPITYSGGPVLHFGPYNSTPTSYDFWYQFNAIGGDKAITQMYITKWNTGNNKRDTLATANALITGPVSVYTHTTVPITWLIIGQIPDSMQLSFVSSIKPVGGGIPTGGMLYLDDINMTSTTGIETLRPDGKVANVYPNPTSDQFFIDANTNDKLIVDLYDINGRHVFGKNVNDKSNIDVTTLKEGIYTLTIKTADGVINKKLVILR
ncbi:MAG TPA: T9SS type A sorting domain-containing protein [Bacteroidia bacterium]|jgi:hypothetical protein|nr:T9SS type A sorting domain-containing protein [Bacteroidia bacterium]